MLPCGTTCKRSVFIVAVCPINILCVATWTSTAFVVSMPTLNKRVSTLADERQVQAEMCAKAGIAGTCTPKRKFLCRLHGAADILSD